MMISNVACAWILVAFLHCAAAAPPSGGLRVGLLTQVGPFLLQYTISVPHRSLLTPTQWPPIKGLYRDAECVAWALQSLPLALRPTKASISDLSVFVVPSLYNADNHTLIVHYLEREWTHQPGNPDPIAHISQPRELSALASALAPRAAVAHSVLAWCAKAAAHRTILSRLVRAHALAGARRCM